MTQHRVVVTGMGLVSPLGNSVAAATSALRSGRSGVVAMAEWRSVDGLGCDVAAPVTEVVDLAQVPRRIRRAMGRQAVFSAGAAQQAVADADIDERLLRSGSAGVAIGSTMGSPDSVHRYYQHIIGKDTVHGIKGTAFLQVMGHTCAANVALMLGVTGRVLAPLSACTSGSQSIGAGYEAVRHGMQDVMICGGADEAHFTSAATFDVVHAASRGYSADPTATPRPFDSSRDGLVVGEGSGVLILERLEHAQARGAKIYAEIASYVTRCDGSHLTQAQSASMTLCMQQALRSAEVTANEVGYINAHATATRVGDPAEARAIAEVFGDAVPVSSTKGQTGHTLGASGALETIFCLLMMQQGFIAGTRNLEEIDEACRGPQHVTQTYPALLDLTMNNNFAFGGINTSLLLRRC